MATMITINNKWYTTPTISANNNNNDNDKVVSRISSHRSRFSVLV